MRRGNKAVASLPRRHLASLTSVAYDDVRSSDSMHHHGLEVARSNISRLGSTAYVDALFPLHQYTIVQWFCQMTVAI
nr:hypothetical protein CFP56_57935 [Quercus suber]